MYSVYDYNLTATNSEPTAANHNLAAFRLIGYCSGSSNVRASHGHDNDIRRQTQTQQASRFMPSGFASIS